MHAAELTDFPEQGLDIDFQIGQSQPGRPNLPARLRVVDEGLKMKTVHSIIATNSPIKLPDGTREILADCALEDCARQINERGFPILFEHDWLRLSGWTVRAWTEREGTMLKLVTEGVLPETSEEQVAVSQRYSEYLDTQLEMHTTPFKDVLCQLGISGTRLAFDVDSVLLECCDLVKKVYPSVLTDIDADGLVRVNSKLIDEDGLVTVGEFFLVPTIYLQ